MSAMLLETAEGLGGSSLNGNAGKFWNLLQSEKETVCKQLARGGPLFQRAPINVVETEPGEESERQIEWRHRVGLEKHLREVVEAQDRLMDGRFGRCANCGADIGSGRLLVEPTASLCVECQSMAEAEELCCTL